MENRQMRSRRHFLARILPLLVLATVSLVALSRAQEADPEKPRRPVYVKLNSGSELRASVLERDGDRYRLQVSISGGTSTNWYGFEDFEDESQVRLLESMVNEGDVAAQFAVAEFALEKNLPEMARRELRRCSQMADKLDPDHHDKLGPRAVALTIKLIDAYAELGKLSDARNGVHRILVRRADQLTPEQKAALVKALDDATADQAAKKDAARAEEATQRQSRERDRRLQPLTKHLDEANKLRHDGLMSSKSYTKASRLFERSIDKYADVVKDAAKLAEQLSGDPVAMAQLQDISGSASTHLTEVLLADASLDLARGQFSRAMGNVNRILADDPQNKQALSMRARIEVAENDWGW